MVLISTSQVIIEELPIGGHGDHGEVAFYDEYPSQEMVLEVHSPDDSEEVEEGIKVDRIPGAPKDAQDDLTVEDSTVEIDEDRNSAKGDRWDLSKHDDVKEWFRNIVDKVPSHSGYDELGLTRAIEYFDRADQELTRAMRNDLDGKFNANEIDQLRTELDSIKSRLNERLDSVVEKKGKGKKKKKATAGISKQAQMAQRIVGITVTVPLLISKCASIMINGSISSGHDMEEIFGVLVKKFALDNREQAELIHLVEQMGYSTLNIKDRSLLVGEDFDPASSDNTEASSIYPTV